MYHYYPDTYDATALNMYYLRQMGVRQRIKTIEDMFGMKPMEPEEYALQNGTVNNGRSLIIGVIGAAVGIAIGIGIAIALGTGGAALVVAPLLLGLAGTCLGLADNNWQRTVAMPRYENYLDNFAAHAREVHEKQQVQAIAAAAKEAPAPQKAAPDKQWATEVTASRENPAVPGVIPG